MDALLSRQIILDYGGAAESVGLLNNLSGAAIASDALWTISDEGRTVECLVQTEEGFKLHRQIHLDGLIDDLPDKGDGELDLEGIASAGDRLWLCGSHCRVRRQTAANTVSPELRDRKSRNLLACFALTSSGTGIRKPRYLPFKGKGSLRKVLTDDPFLAPFMGLPSKENGFDIEGIGLWRGKVLLGLRGPVVDSYAVVVALLLDEDFKIEDYRLHFLDTGGLGVRDLTVHGQAVLIIAGPVSGAPGPFRLLRWKPGLPNRIDTLEEIFRWPDGLEKPEALCALPKTVNDFIVLYDKPTAARVQGATYLADILTLRDP